MSVHSGSIAHNTAGIQDRIARAAARAGRRADNVTLVAISKTFPAASIRAAWEAGVRHFGENRVQEWEAKRGDVIDLEATWHLVGHLQSNKSRRAARLVHSVDSVDSLELARRLDAAMNEESSAGGRRLRVLLEVRLAPEESKSGVEPSELEALARGVLLLPRLHLGGLMCIPPPVDDPEEVRPIFRRARELRDSLRAALAGSAGAAANGELILSALSMGMSHDFEVATEEGATEVRIGSAIFGARG